MSTLRTFILLAGMTALFIGVGFMIGGEQGMMIAFAIAIAMNMFAYWNSDKMVLSMYGAKQVDRTNAPEFYGLVEDLVVKAQLPMPKVYTIEESNPMPSQPGAILIMPPSPPPPDCSRYCRARKLPGLWPMNSRTLKTATL